MALPLFKLASKILESNTGELLRPYKLNFIVTKECHSRCQNCSIWQRIPENELKLDEIRKFAQNTPYLSWVNFSGGEPTDRADFSDVVKTFIEHCPDLYLIHYPTNGLHPKRVERATREILEARPKKLVVTVSIDGPPDVNDKLRGIHGDFNRAIETLNRLMGLRGLQVVVGMTIYQENHDLIEETVAAIKKRIPEFSVHDFHVNLPNVSDHYYGNSEKTRPPTQAMIESLRRYRQVRGFPISPMDWIERKYQTLAVEYLRTGETPLECAALLSSCYLSETGVLYPCTIWNEPIGNIRDTDYRLDPLLESERAKQLRDMILNKKCTNCWTPCEAYQTVLAHVG